MSTGVMSLCFCFPAQVPKTSSRRWTGCGSQTSAAVTLARSTTSSIPPSRSNGSGTAGVPQTQALRPPLRPDNMLADTQTYIAASTRDSEDIPATIPERWNAEGRIVKHMRIFLINFKIFLPLDKVKFKQLTVLAYSQCSANCERAVDCQTAVREGGRIPSWQTSGTHQEADIQ